MATIDLSWSINKELDYYIDICGSQGTMRVGWQESRYRQTASSDWVGLRHRLRQGRRPCAGSSRTSAAAIAGREPLLITAEDAIASVEVIAAAYRSLRESHWVPVRHGIEEPAGSEAPALAAAPAAAGTAFPAVQ